MNQLSNFLSFEDFSYSSKFCVPNKLSSSETPGLYIKPYNDGTVCRLSFLINQLKSYAKQYLNFLISTSL